MGTRHHPKFVENEVFFGVALNLMHFLLLSYKMVHEHIVEKKDKEGTSIYENGCCHR